MNDDNQGGRKLRRGSARWRQQQRKEKQLQQQREKGTRRIVERQVNPADSFKLPEINLPPSLVRPVAYAALAVVLVLGMIFVLRLFNPPEDVTLPNGIWLGTEWSYDLPDDEAVTALVQRMRSNRMGTAYVQTTIMKADRTWGGKAADINPNTGATINTINPLTEEPYRDELAEMEPNILRFIEQYNTLYPEGQLFAWVIFPADVLPLDDRNLHTRMAELSTLLVTTYGFDGVYLDIVPVQSGDQNYVQMLRTVRLALDEVSTDGRVPLALAIPPDYRPSDPDIPFNPNYSAAFAWDRDFKQDVALLADELHIQAYNSGLTRAEDYSVWVAYQ
ncbi:MAG: glycoside hydrolase family 18 protein, partial [Chloroflexota bacterium]